MIVAVTGGQAEGERQGGEGMGQAKNTAHGGAR